MPSKYEQPKKLAPQLTRDAVLQLQAQGTGWCTEDNFEMLCDLALLALQAPKPLEESPTKPREKPRAASVQELKP